LADLTRFGHFGLKALEQQANLLTRLSRRAPSKFKLFFLMFCS